MDERLTRTIIDNMKEGVYYVDASRKILYWNKAAELITGYKQSEVLNRHCQDNLLQHTDAEGKPLCLLSCPLYSTLGDGRAREAEVLLRHKDGHYLPVCVSMYPVYGDDENSQIIGAIELFSLIPPKRTAAGAFDDFIRGLVEASGTDVLTSLPNRRTIQSYIQHKVENYQRFKSHFCILFADIDDFRNFNNVYGHDAGDHILRTVSQIINSHIRGSDLFGRWGGEEFVGIFDIKDPAEAYLLGEKIRSLIEGSCISYQDKSLSVTVSVGVTSILPEDTFNTLMNRADSLMYRSKKTGKNCTTSDYIPQETSRE